MKGNHGERDFFLPYLEVFKKWAFLVCPASTGHRQGKKNLAFELDRGNCCSLSTLLTRALKGCDGIDAQPDEYGQSG